jgi:hypothetical protein
MTIEKWSMEEGVAGAKAPVGRLFFTAETRRRGEESCEGGEWRIEDGQKVQTYTIVHENSTHAGIYDLRLAIYAPGKKDESGVGKFRRVGGERRISPRCTALVRVKKQKIGGWRRAEKCKHTQSCRFYR